MSEEVTYAGGLQSRASGLFNEDEMTKIKIGKRLRAWRVEQGWKGYKLAQVINISQGSLSDLENGNSYPSSPTIIKIMTKTDIDIHWLLLGE